MNNPFKIKPLHWWEYVNPFFWIRKRRVEAFMAYQWKAENMDAKLNQALRDAAMYGEGRIYYGDLK